MESFDIICDGPGPHIPDDGVLGTSSVQSATGMRCESEACKPQPSLEIVSDTDRLRTRIAELEDVLVARGLIDQTDAEVVAAAETASETVARPGQIKSQG